MTVQVDRGSPSGEGGGSVVLWAATAGGERGSNPEGSCSTPRVKVACRRRQQPARWASIFQPFRRPRPIGSGRRAVGRRLRHAPARRAKPLGPAAPAEAGIPLTRFATPSCRRWHRCPRSCAVRVPGTRQRDGAARLRSPGRCAYRVPLTRLTFEVRNTLCNRRSSRWPSPGEHRFRTYDRLQSGPGASRRPAW